MKCYEVNKIADLIRGNAYVGRGLVIGCTQNGKNACTAYFIMGRSANSRNRILTVKEGSLYTEPVDFAKVEDPSLIIYAAIRSYENHLIVTNGDQTDTIYESLKKGKSFMNALDTRSFEPDAPNYTPRISGMLTFEDGSFQYQMSILKSIDQEGSACSRAYYSYPAVKGLGHFIHTYAEDGNPLPSFTGDPERVEIPDDIRSFACELWSALDEDNKISLYVRYTDVDTGEIQEELINKYQ